MSGFQTGFDLVAAKRARTSPDDAPVQVPMRPAPTTLKRNPGTDEKKARRQQRRKTAALSPEDAAFLYQHALDYAQGDTGYAAWYLAQHGSANSLEDVPDHPDALAEYQKAVQADGGDQSQDQQPDQNQQPDQGGNPFPPKKQAADDTSHRCWRCKGFGSVGTPPNQAMCSTCNGSGIDPQWKSTKDAPKKESRMTTEADLLASMASARSPEEQRVYAQRLEALRADRQANQSREAALDLAASSTRTAGLVAQSAGLAGTGVGVTAATDWLSEAAADFGAPAQQIEARMRAEASVWYDSRSDYVKADPAELGAQATGYGRRVASQFGAAAEGAWQAFAAQVEHLHTARQQREALTAMDEVQKPPYAQPVHDYKIPDNKDTFDDSLSTPADPKSTTNRGDAPSLSEGSAPAGDSAEGVDNPAAGNLGHDKDGKDTAATDYLDGTSTPNRKGGDEKFSSLRLTAEGDPKSPAQTSAAPSLAEGDSPEGDESQAATQEALGGDYDRSGGAGAATDSIDGTTYPKQSLRQIAASIAADEARLGRQVHPAARPFLAAMAHLDTVADAFGGVPGSDVVSHFLRSTALHGPAAAAHVAALQQHLAGEVPEAFKKNWGKSSDEDDASESGDGDREESTRDDNDDDPDASESGDGDKKPWRTSTRKVAEGGCATCGDPIERDPAGEANRSYHHVNSGSHDHEARPSGGKEGSLALSPAFAARVQSSLR